MTHWVEPKAHDKDALEFAFGASEDPPKSTSDVESSSTRKSKAIIANVT